MGILVSWHLYPSMPFRRHGLSQGQTRKRKRQPSSGAWSGDDDTSSGAWEAPRQQKHTRKAKQGCSPSELAVAWSDSDQDSGAWSEDSGIQANMPPRIAATGTVDGSDLLNYNLVC